MIKFNISTKHIYIYIPNDWGSFYVSINGGQRTIRKTLNLTTFFVLGQLVDDVSKVDI